MNKPRDRQLAGGEETMNTHGKPLVSHVFFFLGHFILAMDLLLGAGKIAAVYQAWSRVWRLGNAMLMSRLMWYTLLVIDAMTMEVGHR